jgi:hypothetical protein
VVEPDPGLVDELLRRHLGVAEVDADEADDTPYFEAVTSKAGISSGTGRTTWPDVQDHWCCRRAAEPGGGASASGVTVTAARESSSPDDVVSSEEPQPVAVRPASAATSSATTIGDAGRGWRWRWRRFVLVSTSRHLAGPGRRGDVTPER